MIYIFDIVVVGAGLAGCTMAERIANLLNKKVLIIEKRSHIGGNCYDYYDEKGILIHKYGPHIFHTNYKEVWDYLSQFTEWIYYQHRVLAYIDGKKVPIPFNLNSLHILFSPLLANKLEEKLVKYFGYGQKISILRLKNIEDKDLRLLGDYIYEKVFLNYTLKQWGLKPEELDPVVTERVPIYISRDDRYFQDKYQGIPKEGYTRVFERMLKNKNIKILLNCNYKEVLDIDYENKQIFIFGKKFSGNVIYTGKIEEFFNYEFGELPYISINFEFETLDKEYYQEVCTINYPNDYDFTRITEFKHMTGQKSNFTVIVREYPIAYKKEREDMVPCYPIPKEEYIERYRKYLEKTKDFKKVLFIGRLAEYKYYDMDDIIKQCLDSLISFY